MPKKQSLDAVVLEAVDHGYAVDVHDIKQACFSIMHKRGLPYTWPENHQTVPTALKHLIKSGHVKMTLHERGWYRWKTYIKVKNEP